MPLPLFPLCELWGVGVAAISDFPRQHNFTAGTPWVGKVDLLHNDHGVLHVPVQEVYPKTRPRLCHPLTPLYLAVLNAQLSWELNPVRIFFPMEVGVSH